MLNILLFILIALLLLVIFLEYRNDKKYQAERNTRNIKRTLSTPPLRKKNTPPLKLSSTEPIPTPYKEKETIPLPTLPKANHPRFSHSRLVQMGLSEEEVKEFILELIPQIETQVSFIKEAMLLQDFHQMERLTHHIKGSATNIGTGGVADLLIEYNTYLKSGTNMDIAEIYLKHLLHYTKELKAQYN